MELKRDSFIFYRSFYEAMQQLPKEDQCVLFNAIALYCLDGNEVELTGLPKIVWTLIKPQLDANKKRFVNGGKGKEHGKKGGRPPKKQSENPIGDIDKNPIGVTSENPTKTPNNNNNENNNNNLNENKNGNKKKEIVIPKYLEFKEFALKNMSNVDLVKLELKYKSWIEGGWKTGKGQPIKNWKSTLLNTLQYLAKDHTQSDNKIEGSGRKAFYY